MQISDRDKMVELMIAFLDGRAGKDEILSLQTWIAQSEQHRAYFAQIKNIYEMSGRQLDTAEIHTGKALQKVLKTGLLRTRKHSDLSLPHHKKLRFGWAFSGPFSLTIMFRARPTGSELVHDVSMLPEDII